MTTMSPDPAGLVSHDGAVLAQILLKQGEMGSQLAVIVTKLDGIEKAHADHEQRLRVLERFRYTLAGAAVVGGALAGSLGYFLGHLTVH